MLSPPSHHHQQHRAGGCGHLPFLGSTVSSSTSLDAEISCRITKAATVMAKLNKQVWGNDLLSERTKMCVYQACVLFTPLYGCESWTTYARQERQLNAFHLHCLQSLLHIRWQDRVTNTKVQECAGSLSMPSLLIQRCLRWLGHAHCMKPDHLPREILYGELQEGIRCMGRPLLCYKDVIKQDLRSALIMHQCMGGHRKSPRYMAAKCQSGGFKGGSKR